MALMVPTRPLNFLVQNCIRLEPDPFRTQPLDFLVQNVGPFTTATCWHIIYLEKHFKGSRTAERIIWRIGNGENVKIWEDPWLPKGLQENQSHLRDHVC